jgi:hypothetical protein
VRHTLTLYLRLLGTYIRVPQVRNTIAAKKTIGHAANTRLRSEMVDHKESSSTTAVLMSTISPAAKPQLSRRVSACLQAQLPTPTTAKSSFPTSAIAAGLPPLRVPSSVAHLAQGVTLSPSPRTLSASLSARPSSSLLAGTAKTSTHQTTKVTLLTAKAQVLMEVVPAHPLTLSSFLRSCTN